MRKWAGNKGHLTLLCCHMLKKMLLKTKCAECFLRLPFLKLNFPSRHSMSSYLPKKTVYTLYSENARWCTKMNTSFYLLRKTQPTNKPEVAHKNRKVFYQDAISAKYLWKELTVSATTIGWFCAIHHKSQSLNANIYCDTEEMLTTSIWKQEVLVNIMSTGLELPGAWKG